MLGCHVSVCLALICRYSICRSRYCAGRYSSSSIFFACLRCTAAVRNAEKWGGKTPFLGDGGEAPMRRQDVLAGLRTRGSMRRQVAARAAPARERGNTQFLHAHIGRDAWGEKRV